MYRISELASEGWTTMVFHPVTSRESVCAAPSRRRVSNGEREDRHQQGVEKSANQVAHGTQRLALEDASTRDQEVAMGSEVRDELGADAQESPAVRAGASSTGRASD